MISAETKFLIVETQQGWVGRFCVVRPDRFERPTLCSGENRSMCMLLILRSAGYS